jgi:DNA-binding MarR family transcriptional regulator
MSAAKTPSSTVATSPTPWALTSWDDSLYLISKVGRHGTKLFTEGLENLGLKPRHIAALRFIAQNEGASQKDIVHGLWSDSSSVVTLLDDFTARGLAERRPSPKDRRAYAIYLTEQGYQVLNEAETISTQAAEELFAPLSSDQLEELRALLRRLAGGESNDRQ